MGTGPSVSLIVLASAMASRGGAPEPSAFAGSTSPNSVPASVVCTVNGGRAGTGVGEGGGAATALGVAAVPKSIVLCSVSQSSVTCALV